MYIYIYIIVIIILLIMIMIMITIIIITIIIIMYYYHYYYYLLLYNIILYIYSTCIYCIYAYIYYYILYDIICMYLSPTSERIPQSRIPYQLGKQMGPYGSISYQLKYLKLLPCSLRWGGQGKEGKWGSMSEQKMVISWITLW